MFRWPDEDPAQHHPWATLRQNLCWRMNDARQGVRIALQSLRARRGSLSGLTRSRPLPLALALACGLGSAAWALHNVSSGLSVSLARITSGQLSAAGGETGTIPQQPAKDAPAQWGDPLPGTPGSAQSSTASGGVALPPATARRTAGTVVLASQYYGIAPYEPTPAERGNLIAVLSAQSEVNAASPAAAAGQERTVPLSAGDPVNAHATDTAAGATRPLGRLQDGPSVPSGPAAPTTATAGSGSHLAQISEWIGLAESLPVNESGAAARTDATALTLPLTVELARMQQRRLLEQQAGHHPEARKLSTMTDAAAQRGALMIDPGYQAAQVFLDALQARMNHALAQRHERQINRVVSQARPSRSTTGHINGKHNTVADQAVRQARVRLNEAQAAQRQHIQRLTPLIGQVPPALSWGPGSELGLPMSSKQAFASAAANRWTADQQLVTRALMEAYARHETVARRKDSLHGLLLAHAQVAGALHGQMLQGKRELGEVIQAYERLHLSRLAVAALALEELHSQLQVAHATGRLLGPLTAAAEHQRLAMATPEPGR